jgi:hypothetical protein
MKRYTISLELDFETDDDPIDRVHEIMARVLKLFAGAKAEHYHLDARSLRCIDETD